MSAATSEGFLVFGMLAFALGIIGGLIIAGTGNDNEGLS